MSITMFLKELESDKALCREMKNTIARVNLRDASKFLAYCERNYFIDLGAAAKKLGEAKLKEIKKRNGVRGTGEIKADKIKDKNDLEALKPFTREEVTTWVDLLSQPKSVVDEIMSSGLVSDSMNSWDMLSFEQMGEICGKCALSWDKGRGCVATLMSGDSPLPEIARKAGLQFIADIPKHAETKTVFDGSKATELLADIPKLRAAVEKEGKQMANRLKGVIERLESAAKVCAENNVRFYFSS
jgi:hypothetical protein